MVKPRKRSKKRIPKLSHTDNRGIGWYVPYRDPVSGHSRKAAFGMDLTEDEANDTYNAWLALHMAGNTPKPGKWSLKMASDASTRTPGPSVVSQPLDKVKSSSSTHSLLMITTGMLTYDSKRIRPDDAPRVKGTFKQKQFDSVQKIAHYFLAFLTKSHGKGAATLMTLADLKMEDIEKYNLHLVQSDYSDSRVRKHMQVVRGIINRAGRPEHGRQLLAWNWESRDSFHGRPDKPVMLPTVGHLKLILARCNEQRAAMVWMAIGLGFGQSDLSKATPQHFDKDDYDMRRGKTGIDRYGKMPPLVWGAIQKYLAVRPRKKDDRLFVTEDNRPLVHDKTDSVAQWWEYTRDTLTDENGNPANAGLNGFYSLRHTGASEFGSRPGCSLAAMRGWLGHSVSSNVADRYMKPISPEYKELMQWVRDALQKTSPDEVLQ